MMLLVPVMSRRYTEYFYAKIREIDSYSNSRKRMDFRGKHTVFIHMPAA